VGVFEVCLELPSDLKDQFGFVAANRASPAHVIGPLEAVV